jgi:hypothetical protein
MPIKPKAASFIEKNRDEGQFGFALPTRILRERDNLC